jgi:predicted DNA-binding protein
MFTTRIESELIRRLKYLSADTERHLNDLLEEAIRSLLEKYENKDKQ